MMDRRQKTIPTLIMLGVLILTAQPARAYLDPGSGSFFLQILLGGIAGIGVAFSLFWQKILIFFRLRKADTELSDDDKA